MLGQGDMPSLHVGAPIQRPRQPTLTPLTGADKLAAHAAWLQTNDLRRELTGLSPATHIFTSPLAQELSSLQPMLQNRTARPFCPTSAAGMEDSPCRNIHATPAPWISSRTVVLLFS